MKKELIKLLHNYDFREEEIECIVEACEECTYDDGIQLMLESIKNKVTDDRDSIILFSLKLAGCDNQNIIIEKE